MIMFYDKLRCLRLVSSVKSAEDTSKVYRALSRGSRPSANGLVIKWQDRKSLRYFANDLH